MSKEESVWDRAKRYRLFGYTVIVAKANDDDPRRFYTELHSKDDAYLASMGSDQRYYWGAALETYLKRGSLL